MTRLIQKLFDMIHPTLFILRMKIMAWKILCLFNKLLESILQEIKYTRRITHIVIEIERNQMEAQQTSVV